MYLIGRKMSGISSSSSVYKRLEMSWWERRRRPLEGEQLFKAAVEVVHVEDDVTVKVKVEVAIVTVHELNNDRLCGAALKG